MSEVTRMSEVVRPASGHKPETPEGVALELMEMIFFNEFSKPSREDILSTYSECLSAAKGIYRKQEQASQTGSKEAKASASGMRRVSPLQDELAESRAGSVESLNHEAV